MSDTQEAVNDMLLRHGFKSVSEALEKYSLLQQRYNSLEREMQRVMAEDGFSSFVEYRAQFHKHRDTAHRLWDALDDITTAYSNLVAAIERGKTGLVSR